MSLVGQLEDLCLDDILKIIHLSRKSGILMLCRDAQRCEVAFQRGAIVRIGARHVAEAFAEDLVRRGLVDGATLAQAQQLQRQQGAPFLGDILTARFGVAPELLDDVARDFVKGALQRYAACQEGSFSFDLQGEGWSALEAVKPDHIILAQGIVPQDLADDAAETKAGIQEQGEPALENLVCGESASSPLWLVDDDPYIRQELGRYLVSLGFAVQVFESAADFWISLKKACLSGVKPVLVIDLIMPRLNGEGMLGGLELLEKVRNHFSDLRVLPISDHRSPDAEDKVWRLGLAEIYAKPRPAELRASGGRRALAELGASLAAALSDGDPADAVIGREAPVEREPLFSEGRSSSGLHLLKGMLEELNNPSLGGGIILLVLRFASEVMNRAVIFSVKQHGIVGIGQFGMSFQDGATDEQIRRIAVPLQADSILNCVLNTPHSTRTRFGTGRWDSYLCQALGGQQPSEVFLGPIVSEGRVVAILYGDNLPRQSPVGDTEPLEIFLSQAGLAMEKALLEGRVREQ
jgi:DNA-binding NarL/FixJ family response regulator